jgi:hypothetical protein
MFEIWLYVADALISQVLGEKSQRLTRLTFTMSALMRGALRG